MSAYAAYRLAAWSGRHLPTNAAFRVAERLADLWRRCARVRAAAVRQNLSLIMATPNAPAAAEVFRNFGRYLVELFTIHRILEPELRVEGLEHLLDAQRDGRGTIILTGHLGNWELGAILLRRLGFPVSVVALPHDDARVDRLFNRQRERCGLTVIPVGEGAAQRSLQSLREGRLLRLLGDQPFGDQHTLRLRMFGTELDLPRGPAVLSLRSRAPLVPAFLIREGRWKFRLWIEPAIRPEPSGEDESAVRRLIQRYAAVLERYVKRFPEQWLIFQPA